MSNNSWWWTSGHKFQPAPRQYAGNMCGVRVPGLPPVPGGSSDSSLVLSWFYDRYNAGDQDRIRKVWGSKYPDVLLSWPDSRAFGLSPAEFGLECSTLVNQGYRPAVMLASKLYDPQGDKVNFDPTQLAGLVANIQEVVPYIHNVVPRVGIAWESDLWMSPPTLHALIDAIAPIFVAYGCKVYVHFSPGKGSWQENGHDTAYFWDQHPGQLTGLFHQRIQGTTIDQYQFNASGCLDDMLVRFAGGAGFNIDSGFGHPWDLIALEITASEQFTGMSEATGNQWGQYALATTPRQGPLGIVPVMGSGNGF